MLGVVSGEVPGLREKGKKGERTGVDGRLCFSFVSGRREQAWMGGRAWTAPPSSRLG